MFKKFYSTQNGGGHTLLLLLTFFLFFHNSFAQTACSGFPTPPCAENLTSADIPYLPTMRVGVVFHFEAQAGGLNFHCDENGDVDTYAPAIVADILGRANAIFANPLAPIYNASPAYGNVIDLDDTNIRFELRDPDNDLTDPCFGVRLISHGAVFNDVPGVLNIHCWDNPDADGSSGVYFSLNSTIRMYNIHEEVFQSPNSNSLTRWGNILAHEFAHSTGLDHSYSEGNMCDDIDIFSAEECGGGKSKFYR